MKFKEKVYATKLRNRGLSYKEILKKVNVSKSTLSIWLREVELTNAQKRRLLTRGQKLMYEAAKRKVAKRIATTKEITLEAIEEFKILKVNPLFVTGVALYWAEGAKRSMESVKFANSDEKMIIFMMKWFREICKVPEHKFRIHIHMHSLHSRKDMLKYWSNVTGVKISQFYRPYIKPTSLGQRKNILYSGTCSITICDRNLFRRIMGWRLGMLESFHILS